MEHAIQQVLFQVGDDTYLRFDNFDKYLPVAEEIFSTFKTGGSVSDSGEEDEGGTDEDEGDGEGNEEEVGEENEEEVDTNIFN